MICKLCHETYTEPLLIIGDICLDCYEKKYDDEKDEEYKEELKILNEKLRTNFNYQSFRSACHHELIDGKDLKNCPKLWYVNFLIN